MDTFDVFVAAPAQVDYLMHLETVPLPGQTSRIENEVRCPGGSGVWLALCLANWGAKVALLDTSVTDDPNGRFLRRELETVHNLTLWPATEHEKTTPYSVHLLSIQPPAFLRHQSPTMPWSQTLPPARFVVNDEAQAPISPTTFVMVYETTSKPAHQSQCVWWRGEEVSAKVLCALAQNWKSAVVQIASDGSGVYYEANGEVHIWESETAATSPMGMVGVPEVLWAGLVWGDIQGWGWPQKISWARAAATLKRQRIGSVGMIPTQAEILEMAKRLIN
jgi:sugar/nucleoside kinase (ribokinase family)